MDAREDATMVLMLGLEALEMRFRSPAGEWPQVVDFVRRWLEQNVGRVADSERDELCESLFLGARTYVSGFEQLEVGETFLNRYLVTGVLDRIAGEPRVFIAKDRGLGGRTVVLKRIVIQPPPWVSQAAAAAQDQTWLTEAKAQAAVPHRSVVPIHDAHRTAEGAVLSMQFVHAEADPELPAASGLVVHLTARQAVSACAELVHILQVAHSRDITHGDVTPANVAILNADREGRVAALERPKLNLLDFGFGSLAQATGASSSASRSQSQSVLERDALVRQIRGGTPGFMAPERAVYTPVPDDGRPLVLTAEQLAARKRGDLFEAAATLHFWVTGQTVWPKDWDFDTVFEHRDSPRNLIKPRRLRAIVSWALQGKYATAEAFAADLWAWADDEPTSLDDWWVRNTLKVWRNRSVISTAVMVVMLTLAVISSRRASVFEARATASEEELSAAERGYKQLEQRFSVAETESATQYAEAVKRAEEAQARGDANAAALEQRSKEIIESHVRAAKEDRERFEAETAALTSALTTSEEAKKALEARLAEHAQVLSRTRAQLQELRNSSAAALTAVENENKELQQQVAAKTRAIEKYEQREAAARAAERRRASAALVEAEDAGSDDAGARDEPLDAGAEDSADAGSE